MQNILLPLLLPLLLAACRTPGNTHTEILSADTIRASAATLQLHSAAARNLQAALLDTTYEEFTIDFFPTAPADTAASPSKASPQPARLRYTRRSLQARQATLADTAASRQAADTSQTNTNRSHSQAAASSRPPDSGRRTLRWPVAILCTLLAALIIRHIYSKKATQQ